VTPTVVAMFLVGRVQVAVEREGQLGEEHESLENIASEEGLHVVRPSVHRGRYWRRQGRSYGLDRMESSANVNFLLPLRRKVQSPLSAGTYGLRLRGAA